MTAMCSLLFADQPPFVMSQGQPAGARSMNFEGLKRRGFSSDRIAAVKAMYKHLYRENLPLLESIEKIGALGQQMPTAAQDVALMVDFLSSVDPRARNCSLTSRSRAVYGKVKWEWSLARRLVTCSRLVIGWLTSEPSCCAEYGYWRAADEGAWL